MICIIRIYIDILISKIFIAIMLHCLWSFQVEFIIYLLPLLNKSNRLNYTKKKKKYMQTHKDNKTFISDKNTRIMLWFWPMNTKEYLIKLALSNSNDPADGSSYVYIVVSKIKCLVSVVSIWDGLYRGYTKTLQLPYAVLFI